MQLKWLSNLRNIVEHAKKNSAKRQKRYERDLDARVLQALAQIVGDFVYIREEPNAKGKHYLSSRVDGPYRVLESVLILRQSRYHAKTAMNESM